MTSTAPMGIPPSDVGVVVFHGRRPRSGIRRRRLRRLSPHGLVLQSRHADGHAAVHGQGKLPGDARFRQAALEMLVRERKKGVDSFTYDAPAALLFHHGPMADPADCHIAATYAMLAAESLGLGSCMLGTTAGLNHAKPFKAKYGDSAQEQDRPGACVGISGREFRQRRAPPIGVGQVRLKPLAALRCLWCSRPGCQSRRDACTTNRSGNRLSPHAHAKRHERPGVDVHAVRADRIPLAAGE